MSSQVGTTYGTQFEFESTGQRLYSGLGDPNSSQVGAVGDIYFRADCSMLVPAIYMKASGAGTTTGWVPIAGAGIFSANTFAPASGTLTMVGGELAQAGGALSLVGNTAIVVQAMVRMPDTGALTVTGNPIPLLTPHAGALALTGNVAVVV